MERSLFTVSACNRCRKRKSRCDARVPHCLPCQNAGARCEYTEIRTKTVHPRGYICNLESELEALEAEFKRLQAKSRTESQVSPRSQAQESQSRDDSSRISSAPSSGTTTRPPRSKAQADLIRLETGGDAHYLGISSGMHLARSVLESARRNNTAFDSLPQRRGREGAASTNNDTSHRGDKDSPGRGSKTAFPSHEAALNLMDIFFNQYQVQYPILVEDQFVRETLQFYNRDGVVSAAYEDVTQRFMLHVVFAISLLSLFKENPEAIVLAENFNASAMSDLTTIMSRKDAKTLQCLLLLLLYSLINSSTTPIWYISGLCMRMCVDLGMHSERTIRLSGTGLASEDEIETKRRLFWVTYTFDRTLSVILGRPFTLEDKNIDVEYPNMSLPETKRAQIIHWIKLQRLQSSAVSRLYTVRVSGTTPGKSSPDQASVLEWVKDMSQRLALWMGEASSLADVNGQTVDWWRYWYQNALIVLHRPSPNNPTLDADSFLTCYTAAKSMIQLSFIRVHKGDKGLMDSISWVDLHYQFMGGITLLFLVWNSPDVRERVKEEWTSFKSCLVQWELVLEGMVSHWDRVTRAKDVLMKLADATVDIVERDMTKSSNTNMAQRPIVRLTRDRDRRISIMQQLGSPGLGSHDNNNITPAPPQLHYASHTNNYDSQPIGTAEAHNMPVTVAPPEPSQIHMTDCPPLPPPSTHAHNPGPSLTAGDISGIAIEDNTDDRPPISPFWPNTTEAAQHDPFKPTATAMPFSLPADLSVIFNEEMWSTFGAYENTTVAMPGDFGQFDYFSMPMLSGVDAAWADSVLNFHGSWGDGCDPGT